MALGRARAFFRDRATPAGVVARRLLGRATAADEELADHLVRERRRRSRMDGSINGSLVDTARAAWELLDLGALADHAGVVRLTGFLLGRQDAPGRWGELTGLGDGFFSPGPVDQSIAPLTLTAGVVLEHENDARFAASCIALRAILRAGFDERTRVRTHVDALIGMSGLAPTLEVLVLGTVGLASPDYAARVNELAESLVGRQNDDGTWAGVPLCHALEALSTIPTPAAREGVRRAAAPLLTMQAESGSFDEGDSEQLALIAVRALVTARSMLA